MQWSYSGDVVLTTDASRALQLLDIRCSVAFDNHDADFDLSSTPEARLLTVTPTTMHGAEYSPARPLPLRPHVGRRQPGLPL